MEKEFCNTEEIMIVETCRDQIVGQALKKPMRISLELVPREENEFIEEVKEVTSHFPSVDLINVPDIRRNDFRSWDACRLVSSVIDNRVPHIRSCDFTSRNVATLLQYLDEAAVKEVLVVSGDEMPGQTEEGMKALELIEYLKQYRPSLKVYGAIDPYRNSLSKEIAYCKDKLSAGADGFFTQPLFDLKLLEIYAEQLNETDVFWGLCPVVGERNHNYWMKRNAVVFPKGFSPELQWNRDFSSAVVDFVGKCGGNVYFMPIKVPVVDYLDGII